MVQTQLCFEMLKHVLNAEDLVTLNKLLDIIK